MKVLLLSYAVIPAFAKAFESKNATNSAGWVVGIHNGLIEAGCEVAIVSPYNTADGKQKVTDNKTTYYAFPANAKDIVRYNPSHPAIFKRILQEFAPDVVTIFGTEYTQGYAMLQVCRELGLLDRTVIFTQGLISAIARYYIADIPEEVAHHKSLRERFNHMDIASQKQEFVHRGENEKKMLRLAKHIIGGTVWDKTVIRSINPDIQYHYCPEILRDSFYENRWNLESCEKHSVFAVQSGFYPVKGIHYLLEGMYELVKRYPDAKLYMTMNKPRRAKTWKQKATALTYQDYIARLMDEYQLWDHVEFMGSLNEEQLVARYLKSHVFVCASSIENHSQTVSEAKILGVPTVAAFVGGVVERIRHGEDGFHFQHNAPYMIAEYVGRIFEDNDLAQKLSENAHKNASMLVNQEANRKTMLDIYKKIANI